MKPNVHWWKDSKDGLRTFHIQEFEKRHNCYARQTGDYWGHEQYYNNLMELSK